MTLSEHAAQYRRLSSAQRMYDAETQEDEDRPEPQGDCRGCRYWRLETSGYTRIARCNHPQGDCPL